MQPLYTEEQFKNAKYYNLLPLKCLQCGKIFYNTKTYLLSIIKLNYRRPCDFCSIQCYGKYQKTSLSVPCAICNKIVVRKKSEIKTSKSGKSFCSHSCHAKYSNSHKITGTRISKLEKWLQKKLKKLYTKLEFHFNRKDTINSELDIYIPKLKLAFELNGIFHYEPIYGKEKLAQIKNNDNRKMQACLEKKIEFCTIDVSQFKHFKELEAQKFLDGIVKIINSKLYGSGS